MRDKAVRDNKREWIEGLEDNHVIHIYSQDLRDLLTLADERDALQETVTDLNQAAIEMNEVCNSLQAEIERYRNAVPEDVSKALCLMQAESYCAGEQSALGNELDVGVEYGKAMTLIGSLIEKSREKVELGFLGGVAYQHFLQANITGLAFSDSLTEREAAKAYAEKIIGDNHE